MTGDRVTWTMDRVDQALGLAELMQRSGRTANALHSPWLRTEHYGEVRFGVFLLHDKGYCAVQVEHQPPLGVNATFQPEMGLDTEFFVPEARVAVAKRKEAVAERAVPSPAAAYMLSCGSQTISLDGVASVRGRQPRTWAPVAFFQTREDFLDEAQRGGGSIDFELDIDHPLGDVTERPTRTVWHVPVGSDFVRRARPGARIRSRRMTIRSVTARCTIFLKRAKHPGVGRVCFAPRLPFPVSVCIGDTVRHEPPYDFDNLADLVGQEAFDVVIIRRAPAPEGFVDGVGSARISWTVGLDPLPRGECVGSKQFDFMGGSARFVIFPGGNMVADDEDEEVCSVYVQLTGGRGGEWKLAAPGITNCGVIDPCEATTSFGLENVTRTETLEVFLEDADLMAPDQESESEL